MAGAPKDRRSIYEFVVEKGNGIKGLVDLGISQVPEPYVQPPEEMMENPAEVTTFNYPPIDLSKLDGPEHEKVVEEIVTAAERYGFFLVVNHGMPMELLESLKESAHRFHELPPEKKSGYVPGVGPSPVVRYGSSFLPEKEEVWEWKDILVMAYTNDADALAFWPPESRNPSLEYLKRSEILVKKLLRILLGHLGVTLEDSKIDSMTGVRNVMINYYPPCPDPGITLGVGRHSDMSTLTVLVQDDIGGLFVKVEEDNVGGKGVGQWREIPPVPGALVINGGDLLEVLSNGRYKSAEHKAHDTKERARVSIPCFIAPKHTEIIGPLPRAIEKDGGVPRYREMIFGDYVKHYFSIARQGKKSLDFAKI